VRAVLIDGEGAIVARLPIGRREPGFSTTGERLFLGGSCGMLECPGDRIDLFDLRGQLDRPLEPGPFFVPVARPLELPGHLVFVDPERNASWIRPLPVPERSAAAD
jgi:hypothetical protein